MDSRFYRKNKAASATKSYENDWFVFLQKIYILIRFLKVSSLPFILKEESVPASQNGL
jgi:hypothetical protein